MKLNKNPNPNTNPLLVSEMAYYLNENDFVTEVEEGAYVKANGSTTITPQTQAFAGGIKSDFINEYTENNGVSVSGVNFNSGLVTVQDGGEIVAGTSTGLKIGGATNQKLSLWNTTPVVQPTTSVAAATLVGHGGTPLTSTDTFNGYTLSQVVKALQLIGILA